MSDGPLKEVVMYTDGGAEPNPGPGGYGVVLRYGKHCKELSGGFKLTTNNRMELLGAIVGLEALSARCSVELHSDSKYLVDSVTKNSVFKWRDNDWHRTPKHKAKNIDLWERFLAAYAKHKVQLIWVKGHAGIPDNERCDQLAFEAIKSADLLDDTGYTEPVHQAVPLGPTANRRIPKPKKPGDLCRECETPLVERKPKKRRKRTLYYYEWYLYCEGCARMYMVEEGKRHNAEYQSVGECGMGESE